MTANHVEVVRGVLADERAEQILDLWSSHGALSGDAAQERLGEVVGVLVDEADAVVGVSTAKQLDVAELGGRRLWLHRRFLAPGVSDADDDALFLAAFALLEGESSEDGPVGVCTVVDEARLHRRPAAVWPETSLLHAARLPDGRSLRVRYFDGALITTPLPGRRTEFPPPERWAEHYPISDEYAFGPPADTAEVVALWEREADIRAEEAARRVAEIEIVATHGGEVVGVSSTYLQRNEQVGLDLWYVRVFVAEAHRSSNVAIHLLVHARERLEQRFLSGEDRRGIGFVAEIEHPGLRRQFPQAVWPTQRITFVGERASGAHVYLRYFPGAVLV